MGPIHRDQVEVLHRRQGDSVTGIHRGRNEDRQGTGGVEGESVGECEIGEGEGR